MRAKLLILCSILGLAACSFEIPSFLGREGGGGTTYELGSEPLPDPVPLAVREAHVEPALHGVILRVSGLAPAQGYFGATLLRSRVAAEPGILAYEFVALPPDVAEIIGPPATRELRAGLFFSYGELRGVRGFRVSGSDSSQILPVPARAPEPAAPDPATLAP
jgi:hypothetical protein